MSVVSKVESKIKVSIVIPVWNAGERIRKCLDTLLAQTLRDIEIICVLDCPTDGTNLIVEEYAMRDSRIVIIDNEESLHVSGSRNRGIEAAKGEYIGFSDHDDYRQDLTMYEELYSIAMKEDVDIVASDAIFRYEEDVSKDEYWGFTDMKMEKLVESTILSIREFCNPQMVSHCVWHSIYRKSFLDKNNIRFRDRNYYTDEDRLFNFEAYLQTSKVGYINKAFYVWVQYNDSLTRTERQEWAMRKIRCMQFIVDTLRRKELFEKYKKTLWNTMALELRLYLEDFKQMSIGEYAILGKLMRDMNYPFLGGDNGLRVFGRKRTLITLMGIIAKFYSCLLNMEK